MDRKLKMEKMIFVIPSVNGGALLERMFPSLNVSPNLVYVLDQGSTDSTQSVCESFGVNLVQLGAPTTYTKACNLGIELAREKGCEFVLLANNDIVFLTDVAISLINEMLLDERLGIVAPSQILIDSSGQHVAYRVRWDLENLIFDHDFDSRTSVSKRVESDFCELTCALVRIEAVEKIGGFDNNYGFYHEDADLCFRLRQHGYNSAYLPHAQIAHYHSSTMSINGSSLKEKLLVKNKQLFATKFLGFGIAHADHKSTDKNSWNILNINIHKNLKKFGMLDPSCPELIFSHPGVSPFDYLYTVWETTKLPASWLEYRTAYRAVFTPSAWMVDVLQENGFENVHYLPHGIDVDIFQPWGARDRFYEEKTFLWFANNQYRKGLDVMLIAWSRFHDEYPDARLIIMGSGVSDAICDTEAPLRIVQNFKIFEDHTQGITVFEIVMPLNDSELATIYRSVDFYVSTSRSEGFGFTIGEAMASGAVAIFPSYSGCSEFCFDGALSYAGTPCLADYSDKGFSDVGYWWEPDLEDFLNKMRAAYLMSSSSRRELAERSVRYIRSKYTWRHFCAHLRTSLEGLQEQKNVNYSPAESPANVSQPFSVVEFAKSRSAEASKRNLGNEAGLSQYAASKLAQAFAGFDPEYYIETNVDLQQHEVDPLTHYIRYGWKEARTPSPHFSTPQLLAANPEACEILLQQIGMDAPIRFSDFGVKTDRLQLINRMRNSLLQSMSWSNKHQSKRESSKTPVNAKPKLANPTPKREDPLFIGYVEAALGIGESTRAMLRALSGAMIPFSIFPLNKNVETRFVAPFMPELYDISRPHEINIIEVAVDQLAEAVSIFDADEFNGSYNILRTYCELPIAPEKWREPLKLVDEIWAPTTFVRDSLRAVFDKTITIIPTCVNVKHDHAYGRRQFGLEEGVFYYIFSFDYYSTPSRKNPLAVIRAFREAFPRQDNERVGLVIKTVGPAELNRKVKMAIDEALMEDDRIVSIDRNLTRDEMTALLAQCDCYVSLHRAEGFGLGMAESLALGTAVVGTNFSGNVDFLSEGTGFLVDFSLRKLRFGEYYDGDGQFWAEPDHKSAVSALREVFSDERKRVERSLAGSNLIRTKFGEENVAQLIGERLAAIRASNPKSKQNRGGA